MDEKNLVTLAAGGDKNAFAALYTRYRDDLYRYAYFRLGNAEDARDAVSACIVSAYEGVYALRAAGAFRAWIFRILYYSCVKLIAEQNERRNRAEISELDRVEATDNRLSPELQEALEALPQEDRDIVLLSVIAGYNSREIASMTGFKPATVRSRLSRALAKMKAFLE